ncbi:MAG TPA: hypothetical protein VGF25_13820 [Thermoleophilaceae bacterium]|jgi:hypothetical protein
MALQRGLDDSEPVRPVGRMPATHEYRQTTATLLAVGTLACPGCDAPVVPPGPMSPADVLGCGFCLHTAPVRDFLSLAPPTRPTRVDVRVIMR